MNSFFPNASGKTIETVKSILKYWEETCKWRKRVRIKERPIPKMKLIEILGL